MRQHSRIKLRTQARVRATLSTDDDSVVRVTKFEVVNQRAADLGGQPAHDAFRGLIPTSLIGCEWIITPAKALWVPECSRRPACTEKPWHFSLLDCSRYARFLRATELL